MNHITNLYNTSMDDFNVDYVWPVIFVSLGAILLFFGTLLWALHEKFWAQILSIIFVMVSIITIVVGSDTAPRNKNA